MCNPWLSPKSVLLHERALTKSGNMERERMRRLAEIITYHNISTTHTLTLTRNRAAHILLSRLRAPIPNYVATHSSRAVGRRRAVQCEANSVVL